MKVLLAALNAKYIHSNPALYSLRAYAGKYKEHIELAEYTINQSLEEIMGDIYKRKPDVLAFSCYIWNISPVLSLTKEIKKILPETDLWLGGPEVSYNSEQVLRAHEEITGIMEGEGEETFLELMEHYVEGSRPLTAIKGLALKEGRTGERPLTDLDKLPFLYERLEDFQNKIIYYESSRGCPFRCSYCLSSIDKTVRLRRLDIVKNELQFFLDNRVKQVKFVDRTFNCNHEHAISIWQYIKEHDNGITNFHFEVAADLLNEKEISLLNTFRPGAVQLEIGVQSTNPVTISQIQRVMDIGKLKETVKAIKKGGNIHQHLDLIAGLPYEDFETFQKSFNEVYAMEPEQLQLGFLKILKGSPMHKKAEEYGIAYTSYEPYEVLYTKWLSYEEIRKLKRVEEMVELYYNSGQFTATIPLLEKLFESPFAFYEALAEYYEEKGYFVNSPSRTYRYLILLEFAINKIGSDGELFKELLTMDFYLRENAKSRPEFAKNLSPYKDKIRAIYREEEAERKLLPHYRDYDARQMAKMTHIEVFNYDLHSGKKLPTPQMLLFDYRNRSPLTNQAALHEVFSDA
ncbi:MAG: B12-binding domain-containing radical SAM protein [Lachnospiraceae bacterium]|nr:B12-binding domain-containing radical SAM protein [Lachnospiraceae bacterium]